MDRPKYPGPAGAKQHDDRHIALDKGFVCCIDIRFGEKLLRFGNAELIPFPDGRIRQLMPISVARTITGKLTHLITNKIPIPNEHNPNIEVIEIRIRSGKC